MRIWPVRTDAERKPGTAPESAVVTAVDAALGFVAGQGWVPRQTAIVLVETVREVAAELDTPEQLRRLIGAALEKCDTDRVLAATLVDDLLDIRNAARLAAATTR
jgi:hypothetical protein